MLGKSCGVVTADVVTVDVTPNGHVFSCSELRITVCGVALHLVQC